MCQGMCHLCLSLSACLSLHVCAREFARFQSLCLWLCANIPPPPPASLAGALAARGAVRRHWRRGTQRRSVRPKVCILLLIWHACILLLYWHSAEAYAPREATQLYERRIHMHVSSSFTDTSVRSKGGHTATRPCMYPPPLLTLYWHREGTQLRALLSNQTLHLRDAEKPEDFARFRVKGWVLGA